MNEMKAKISIIAAIGRNRELGKDNKLLWYIPEDLKRFKKLTEGHAVIMGRKTYESIGKPLPNRINIVVTKDVGRFFASIKKSPINPNLKIQNTKNLELGNCCLEIDKNFFVSSSIDYAFEKAKSVEKEEIFVIGGGQIYTQALPLADKLYLTIVEKTPDHPEGKFEADTFFPEYREIFTKKVFEKKIEKKGFCFWFLELERF